jgi:nicotinate-nucleotide adenylyltransferase
VVAGHAGQSAKDVRALPPLESRVAVAAEVAAHPRIVVTGVERQLRTRYTADFLQILTQRSPAARFVWLMGSDLLTQFHRWDRWRDIAAAVPIAVFNRPGHLAAPLSGAPPRRLLATGWTSRTRRCSPTWRRRPGHILTGPRTAASSTALRSETALS